MTITMAYVTNLWQPSVNTAHTLLSEIQKNILDIKIQVKMCYLKIQKLEWNNLQLQYMCYTSTNYTRSSHNNNRNYKRNSTRSSFFIIILLLCYSYIIIQILLPSSMSYNYNHIFGDIILCDTCFFIIQEKKNVKSGKRKENQNKV